jgi:hypothetical protein
VVIRWVRRHNIRVDDRAEAKRDADNAAHFFDRCLARGLSRAEAIDLTVAYVLGRRRREREPWEIAEDERED